MGWSQNRGSTEVAKIEMGGKGQGLRDSGRGGWGAIQVDDGSSCHCIYSSSNATLLGCLYLKLGSPFSFFNGRLSASAIKFQVLPSDVVLAWLLLAYNNVGDPASTSPILVPGFSFSGSVSQIGNEGQTRDFCS